MNKFTVAAVVAMLLSGSAWAQSENFTGFSAAVGFKGADMSTYTDIVGKTSYGADVRGSYGFKLSNDIILNVGASLDLGDSTVYKFDNGGDYSQNMKTKNKISFYVEPGILISNKTLLYGKISHNSAKINSTYNDLGAVTSESSNTNGLGFGLGVKSMINDKTYVLFEVNKVSYSSTYNNYFFDSWGGRISSTSATIAIGYKFN